MAPRRKAPSIPDQAQLDAEAEANRNRWRSLSSQRQVQYHMDELASIQQTPDHRDVRRRGVTASVRFARHPNPSQLYVEEPSVPYCGRSEEPTPMTVDADEEEEPWISHAPMPPTQESTFSYRTPMPPPSATPASTSRGYTPTETDEFPYPPPDFFVPATGAPIYGEVEHDYNTHVARQIWIDPNLDTMKNVHRRERWGKRLRTVLKNADDDAHWKMLVMRTNVVQVLDCELQHVDHTVVSAFVERWYPSDNTFHMSFGEMTVTLHDVHMITGLPINRRALDRTMADGEVLVEVRNMWGFTADEAQDIMTKGGIMMVSLMNKMETLMLANGSPEIIATTFLMLLFGCTLFMDKTTNRVDYRLVEYVMDHSHAECYAWGVGALTYMYRQLGEGSRSNVNGISGLTPLLHQWIWLYFPALTGHANINSEVGSLPAGSQHLIDMTRLRDPEMLLVYRRVLDSCSADHVTWQPFATWPTFPGWDGDLRYSAYRGVIRCCRLTEAYQPDKCMRQFGRIQCISLSSIVPSFVSRGRTGKTYTLTYSDDDDGWNERDEWICQYIWDQPEAVVGYADAVDYLGWYVTHCHPFVLPTSYESMPPRLRSSGAADIYQRFNHIVGMVKNLRLSGDSPTREWVDDVYGVLMGGNGPPIVRTLYTQSQSHYNMPHQQTNQWEEGGTSQ